MCETGTAQSPSREDRTSRYRTVATIGADVSKRDWPAWTANWKASSTDRDGSGSIAVERLQFRQYGVVYHIARPGTIGGLRVYSSRSAIGARIPLTEFRSATFGLCRRQPRTEPRDRTRAPSPSLSQPAAKDCTCRLKTKASKPRFPCDHSGRTVIDQSRRPGSVAGNDALCPSQSVGECCPLAKR